MTKELRRCQTDRMVPQNQLQTKKSLWPNNRANTDVLAYKGKESLPFRIGKAIHGIAYVLIESDHPDISNRGITSHMVTYIQIHIHIHFPLKKPMRCRKFSRVNAKHDIIRTNSQSRLVKKPSFNAVMSVPSFPGESRIIFDFRHRRIDRSVHNSWVFFNVGGQSIGRGWGSSVG